MKRMLVVGCGGTGAATLAYLMDHLRDSVTRRGWDEPTLPPGWRFVVVDVPPTATSDTRPAGRPPTIGLGEGTAGEGTYLSVGYPSGDYPMLDQALTNRLSLVPDGFRQFATWAPRDPRSVNVPLTRGAGQFRAVGRALTLNSITSLQDGLGHVVKGLTNARAGMEKLAGLFRDDYQDQDKPLVLVVSSMAGGAGASMTLDVCRLLRTNPDLSGAQIAVFLVTADVFSDQDKLPEDVRRGVKPNALAMLGEIVAAQNGAARASDAALLAAAEATVQGLDATVPFDRVFPVSARVGGTGIPLGDGSPEHVYRALGIGLASLMISGKTALDGFVSFDLTNRDLITDGTYFGWGADDPAALAWGSFGYASLSMGRHRYEHYAAQRLAATSVERLLHGHEAPGQSDHDAVEDLIHRIGGGHGAQLGLPTTDPFNAQVAGWWFDESVIPRRVWRDQAALAVTKLVGPYLEAGSRDAEAWLAYANQVLGERSRPAWNALLGDVERQVFAYQGLLRQRTDEAFSQAIGDYGLAYASRLADVMADWVESTVAPVLQDYRASEATGAVWQVPDDIAASLRGAKSMPNAPAIREKVLQAVAEQAADQARLEACGLTAHLLVTYATDVLRPLRRALDDAYQGLSQAARRTPAAAGTSDLRTTDIQAWPTDAVPLPDRFRQAQNEVLLTDAADFPRQYEVDVPASWARNGGDDAPFSKARNYVAAQVITGRWPVTAGTPAPGGLLTGFDAWVSKAFPRNPETGRTDRSQPAEARVHVRAQDLIDRALALVRRPGDQAFSTYTSVTLRDWLTVPDRPEEERARHDLVATKFKDALELARPLSGANPRATALCHKVAEARYRFKFSPIPFPEELKQRLADVIASDPRIDASVAEPYTNACRAGEISEARDISVFGSYQPFSPLVFDSLLEPIAAQRDQTRLPSARSLFWRQRRARPLPAALPLSDHERQAMATGWLIGQITGHLRLPERGESVDRPIEIWSGRLDAWTAFPHPLLTPPGFSDGPYHFQAYDWLPAVLESILLAYANANRTGGMDSLEPYIALRGLYDDRAQPTGGQEELAARVRLRDWLRSGVAAPDGWSRVPRADRVASPEDRHAAVKDWLTGPNSPQAVIAADFKPPAHGARGGQFANLQDRRVAARLPLFADVYADVEIAIDRIMAQLDQLLRELAGDRPPEVLW